MKKIYSIFAVFVLAMMGFVASALNVTINIDHADRVELVGVTTGTTLALEDGPNVVEVPAGESMLRLDAKPGFVILSAEGGDELTNDKNYMMGPLLAFLGPFTYTFTTGVENAPTEGKCTVTVDDASRVRLMLSGSYTEVALANGDNEVKFNIGSEDSFSIMPADYSKPLYEVRHNGTKVDAYYDSYTVQVADGDNIVITALYPDVDVPVKFTYVNDGTSDCFKSVTVDGVEVTNYNDAGFTVKLGSSLGLVPDDSKYTFSYGCVSVNGDAQYIYAGWSTTILADTEITVDVTPKQMYNVTFNVDNAAAVSLYVGNQSNGDVVALTDGANVVPTGDGTSYTIVANDGYLLSDVVRVCEGMDDESAYIRNNECSIYYMSMYGNCTFNITTVDITALRTATATVIVDDPSLVRFSLPTGEKTLVAGEQQIKFSPEHEGEFSISQATGSPIYKVERNGEEVVAGYGIYTLSNMRDGETVKITAKMPEGNAPIHFVYADEESKGFVERVMVNYEDVQGFNEPDFAVPYGVNFTFTGNTDNYKLDELKVNDTEITSFYGSYSFSVTGETTIYIKAHRYGNINVTVDVDHADRVEAYIGSAWNNKLIDLVDGVNTIEVSEMETTLSFKLVGDATFVTLSNGSSDEFFADFWGTYSVPIEAGTVITIVTSVPVRDDEVVVYVPDNDYYTCTIENTNRYMLFDGTVAAPGYNIVKLDAAHDNPFNFSCYWNGEGQLALFQNGERLEGDYDTPGGFNKSEWTVSAGDVIKIFKSTPEEYDITFELSEPDLVEVKADIITPVTDLASAAHVLSGTQFDIVVATGKEVASVMVDDKELEGVDGKYTFVATANSVVKIQAASGIDDVIAADGNANVYNLQGVLILSNATKAQIKALPAGLYIAGGKKVYIK